MRKLIIGCGYLGERVAREWLAAGHETWVLTRSQSRADHLADAGFQTLVGDVLDVASLQRLPRAETILYAVGFDPSQQASKREVYVDGLRNLLLCNRLKCSHGETILPHVIDKSDHLRAPALPSVRQSQNGGSHGWQGRSTDKTGVDSGPTRPSDRRSTSRRFIYISSTSVYGQDDGEVVNESSPALASSESGCICRDAEAAVWEAFPNSHHDPVVDSALILRLSGIYGPGRLLARVEQLRRGVALAGNPDAWLNLIHVEDAVQAVLAAEVRGQAGSTYLISDDRPLRRHEYYAELAHRIGLPAPTFEPLAADALERQRLNKRCENRRLREELGVELKYPTVSDGLRHLFAEPQ